MNTPAPSWHTDGNPVIPPHTKLDCRCALRANGGIIHMTLSWLNDWSPFGVPDDGNPLASLTAHSGWNLITVDETGKESRTRSLKAVEEVMGTALELVAWHPLPEFSARRHKNNLKRAETAQAIH